MYTILRVSDFLDQQASPFLSGACAIRHSDLVISSDYHLLRPEARTIFLRLVGLAIHGARMYTPTLPRALAEYRPCAVHPSVRVCGTVLDGATSVVARCDHRRCFEASDEGSAERPSNRHKRVAYAGLLPDDKPVDRNICVGRAKNTVVCAVVVHRHNNEPARRSARV
jgi:hypothetical protein